MDQISLDDCKPRCVYRLRSRNLALGVYNPDSQGFIGIRTKFGSRFLFTEYHWDKSSLGTAVPVEALDVELPKGVELREGYSCCGNCGAPCIWVDDPDNHYSAHAITGYANACDEPKSFYFTNRPLFEFLESIEEKYGRD